MTLVRYAVASLLLLFCLYGALVLALAFGTYYPTDVGFDLLWAKGWFVAVGVVVGLYGSASFLGLTHRRVLSPWLLVGLLPSAFAALTYLGVRV